MPVLRCKQNFGFNILSSKDDNQTIGVKRKDGDYQYLPFYGFIDKGSAERVLGKTVRLEVYAYAINLGDPWIYLSTDEYMLGYLTHAMTVYAVWDDNDLPCVLKNKEVNYRD